MSRPSFDNRQPFDWTYYVRADGEQRVRRREHAGRASDRPARSFSAFLDKGWKGVRRNTRTKIFRGRNPMSGDLQDVPPELQAWGEARLAAKAASGPFRIEQTLYRDVGRA